MKRFFLMGALCLPLLAAAQTAAPDSAQKAIADSAYIAEVEAVPNAPAKVLHAEPLYIDLIRDLGARKGEREWNYGLELLDNQLYDRYLGIVEYEWAPVNRLGVEAELQVEFFSRNRLIPRDARPLPENRVRSLKLAVQYTFLVAPQAQTSLAVGYLHEVELTGFQSLGRRAVLQEHILSPFLVGAKRWGNNWHTLIYTGPLLYRFTEGERGQRWHTGYQLNTSAHYMITGTRNFVGVELNKLWGSGFDMVIRPQMRVGISDNLLMGIVVGVPVEKSEARLSMFLRLIWEPRHGPWKP